MNNLSNDSSIGNQNLHFNFEKETNIFNNHTFMQKKEDNINKRLKMNSPKNRIPFNSGKTIIKEFIFSNETFHRNFQKYKKSDTINSGSLKKKVKKHLGLVRKSKQITRFYHFLNSISMNSTKERSHQNEIFGLIPNLDQNSKIPAKDDLVEFVRVDEENFDFNNSLHDINDDKLQEDFEEEGILIDPSSVVLHNDSIWRSPRSLSSVSCFLDFLDF